MANALSLDARHDVNDAAEFLGVSRRSSRAKSEPGVLIEVKVFRGREVGYTDHDYLLSAPQQMELPRTNGSSASRL